MGGVIVEDAVKSAARKAAEDAAKKAAEDAAKDAAKKAAEDAAKKAAEDAAKKAAEDAAKDASKKAAEDAAKKAAEDAAKDAAKKAAEDAAKKAAGTGAVRSAGALTRDFMLNASKVISNLPIIGPFLRTIGVVGGVYEVGKHTIFAPGPPPKPEGAAEVVGPDGKTQPVRPISKEDAEHRNPADFAKNKDGSQAYAPDGRPYVKYDPKDPNETFHSMGFLDNIIKWVADIEKNPSIAPFAPFINAGIVLLAGALGGSLLNPALGGIMALGGGALMYFKGNDFIKERAAAIQSHEDWQTKHYFNSSAQGAPQQSPVTPVTPQRAPGSPAPG